MVSSMTCMLHRPVQTYEACPRPGSKSKAILLLLLLLLYINYYYIEGQDFSTSAEAAILYTQEPKDIQWESYKKLYPYLINIENDQM